jgi:glycosyltransferase involved in cell wall biosynthesis
MKSKLIIVDTIFLSKNVNRAFHDYLLTNLIKSLKFDITVITSRDGKNFYNKFVGLKVINLNDKPVYESKIGFTVNCIKDIFLLTILKIDVNNFNYKKIIICQFTGLFPDVAISLILKLKLLLNNKISLIYSSFYNLVPSPWRRKFNLINFIPYFSFKMTRFLLLFSDHVDFYLNKQDYKYLDSGDKFKKKSFLYYGIDKNKIDKIRKSNSKKYDIIYFGRISYDKGMKEFFEIIKKLKRHISLKVLILGNLDVDFKNAFDNYLIKDKLKTIVDYKGYVEENALYKYLQQSKIFLFLSHYESQPTALLNALYSDLICVTSNISALNQYPYNKFNLYKYSIVDKKNIVKKLLYILKNFNKFKKNKNKNKNLIQSTYNNYGLIKNRLLNIK